MIVKLILKFVILSGKAVGKLIQVILVMMLFSHDRPLVDQMIRPLLHVRQKPPAVERKPPQCHIPYSY